MACFVVAYDLNKAGQNYTNLIAALERMPNCHAQGSVWFVEYSAASVALRDYLGGFLDDNDKLFISEVSKQWAGKGMPNCGKWLNDLGY